LLNGDQYEYHLIKKCCSNTDMIRFFSHWKKIPVHALILLIKYPILIRTSLLYGLLDLQLTLSQQQSVFFSISHTMKDIERMAYMMKIKLSKHYYKSLNTIHKVNRAHDRLIDRLNESNLAHNSNTLFFPICPLADTDNIIQIKNSVELANEGRSMHHCVAAHGPFLLEGNHYIYKVINPERGTLRIALKGNKYNISQFKLVCNGTPSLNSFKIVHQWLSEAKKQMTR